MPEKDALDVLFDDRNYHIAHVQMLNNRVAFVAMTFAGLLLIQALSINTKRQELYKPGNDLVVSTTNSAALEQPELIERFRTALIQDMMEEGSVLDQMISTILDSINTKIDSLPVSTIPKASLLEQLPTYKTDILKEVKTRIGANTNSNDENAAIHMKDLSQKIAEQVAESLREHTVNLIFPQANKWQIRAFKVASFGLVLLIVGLLNHTNRHIRKARELESELAKTMSGDRNTVTKSDSTRPAGLCLMELNQLIIREPDPKSGVMNHDTQIFVGIGAITSASLVVAFFLLFDECSAKELSYWVVLPSTISAFLYIAWHTVKPITRMG